MKNYALLLSLCCMLFICSCKKPVKEKIDVPPVITDLKNDEIGIYGTLQNNLSSALVGALVTIDGKQVQTDDLGNFEFNATVTDPNKVVIRIKKTGYFSFCKILSLEKNTAV